MSVKKSFSVEFDLSKDASSNGRRWGRLYCVLNEISRQIDEAQCEGYEIPASWAPPEKFEIPFVENPEKVELWHLRLRLKKLREQIREKQEQIKLGS